MPRVAQPGAATVFDIGSAGGGGKALFDLSSPAGWTMLWWFLSIAVIVAIFIML